jgi:mono/diheme cytochrome c family protein
LKHLSVRGGAVGAGRAASGDPAKGKTVFENCAVCHNADSTETKMGPGLKGLFKRDKLKSGKKVTEANVRARIDDCGDQSQDRDVREAAASSRSGPSPSL